MMSQPKPCNAKPMNTPHAAPDGVRGESFLELVDDPVRPLGVEFADR